jgi:microcystin-dependent protein
MATPYIGEIRAFGFSFAPVDWAFCNGQFVAIDQNPALFQILGTIYGGDGVSTFALPNLQGRVPMHWGNGPENTTIGQIQGTTEVTLTINQTPSHSHTFTADQTGPGGVVERSMAPTVNSFLGPSSPDRLYNTSSPTLDAPFAPSFISAVGGSQPHENMQPYLAINFCIALNGIFPARN